MKKKERQSIIKRIILQNDIETQEDLIAVLEQEGEKVTQATISRDIREMSIVKTHNAEGKIKYAIFNQGNSSNEKKLQETIEDSMLKITQIQFMNVMHTMLGNADVVAALLDEIKYPEIEGTMAGTDTIIIISHSVEEATIVHDRLEKFLK